MKENGSVIALSDDKKQCVLERSVSLIDKEMKQKLVYYCNANLKS